MKTNPKQPFVKPVADFVENFQRTADDLMCFVFEQELGIGHSKKSSLLEPQMNTDGHRLTQ